MKKELLELVDNFFSLEQKVKAYEVIRETHKSDVKDSENHLLNYKILQLALGNNIEILSEEKIKEFYGEENFIWLTEVDFVIANILVTCEKITGKDIRTKYENKIVLSKEEPEFEYLLKVVEEIMEGEK